MLKVPSSLRQYLIDHYSLNITSMSHDIKNKRFRNRSDFIAPNNTIIHYLDLLSGAMFLTKDIEFYNLNIAGKRKPVDTLLDLTSKEGNPIPKDRTIPRQYKLWYSKNSKDFISVDMRKFKGFLNRVTPVVNYNLLKFMYKYRNNDVYYSYYNLRKTSIDYLNQVCESHSSKINIVDICIPKNVAPFSIQFFRIVLDRYFKTNRLLDLSRILVKRYTHEKFLPIMETFHLFAYFTKSYRHLSIFDNISKENVNKVWFRIVTDNAYKIIPISVIFNILQPKSINDPNIPSFSLHLDENVVMKFTYVLIKSMLAEVEDKNKDEEEDSSKKDEKKDELDTEYEKLYSKYGSLDESDEEELEKEYKEEENLEDTDQSELVNILNKETEDTSGSDLEIDILSEKEDDEEKEVTENVYIDSYLNENIFTKKEATELFLTRSKEALDLGVISKSDLDKLENTVKNRKSMVSPYDNNIKLDDFKTKLSDIEINEEEFKIDVDVKNLSKEYFISKIEKLDNVYINKLLKKDIVSVVSNIEKDQEGLIISDYKITTSKDSINSYELHEVTFKNIKNKEMTLKFKIPIVNEEGEYIVNGIKKRLRKQRSDLPIRKINPFRVALTSNYGKLFIDLTQSKSYNPFEYLVSHIKNRFIQGDDFILNIVPGNTFNNYMKLPNMLGYLSMNFISIDTKDYLFDFSTKEYENGKYIVGYDKSDKNKIYMDEDGRLYKDNNEYLGDFFSIFSIDKFKLPKQYTNIKIMGTDIPLGLILSYYIGLDNLLAIYKSKYKLISSDKKYKKEDPREIVIDFLDYKMVILPSSYEASLIFNSLELVKDMFKSYDVKSFKDNNIYLNIIESYIKDVNIVHIREIQMLRNLFIDPITESVLIKINEPTDFVKLLIRANSLFKDTSHPDQNDPHYSIIRGYDRIPGLLYKQLIEALRRYKLSYSKSANFSLDPYEVWNKITTDNTNKLTEDINPILDLKEVETVTLTGSDGLSKDATPKELRRYHPNDLGLTSEATIDSSDVALNVYLSPFAKIENLRGMISKKPMDEKEPYKTFSTSVLLAPMAEYDDPKRINFINIQNGHTIPSYGYMQPIIRTEYEYVMPYRVGKLYAIVAQDDGIVLSITDTKITVKYTNLNTIKSYQIGKIYGRMEGSYYLHNVVTDLKENSEFKKDDILAYNQFFFEKDWLYKDKYIFKTSRYVNVALSMTNEVFEDSSAISHHLSKEITTSIIKPISNIIPFDKEITELPKVGTKIKPNDTIYTIVEKETDLSNLSETTLMLLESISNKSVKSKYEGVIESYEVKYNGELSDMSESLRRICTKLDQKLIDDTSGTEYEAYSNKVDDDYRIGNINLPRNHLELKVNIRVELDQGVGDKGVFANQMKSVVSDVYHHDIYTESNDRIDALFSYKGILNRIVLSPILIGTTGRILDKINEKVVDIYFKKK
ncbi:MAG: hypothetical protein QXF12_01400 [Candidatus Aenigmatarchaeota archaeon]